LFKRKIQRLDFLGIKEDETKSDMLEGIIVDINQAQEMANIYSNILAGTMDTFASIISNNLNVVIQRLTLITIVLMVPTLVSSFYGMNIKLPFQDTPYAFTFVVTLAVLLSMILVFVFRRTKML
jgi:magnesium transporter